MTTDAPTESLICTLDGVTCAGCMSKIETALGRQEGVILARGNTALKRIRLVWDPAKQSADSLIEAIGHIGYSAFPYQTSQPAKQEASLLTRLGIAGFSMMNIMAISFAVWIGLVTDMGPGSMQFLHGFSALLATPVVFYSASVFLVPSLRALKAGRMTMDTPISLAIIITYGASCFEFLRGASHVYFDAVVALVFFLLIGRVLERSLKRRSGDAADNLRSLMHMTARRQTPGGEMEDVSAEALSRGDVILVETGERVPADAELLSDSVQVDESVITGETLPRDLIKGQAVAAGAIIYAGPAMMRVTHVGEDAQLGRISQMIEQATSHTGSTQRLADRFARSYIPIVMLGGMIGFTLWYVILGAGFADALMIAVAVLVVTCPCAAGLATPAVSAHAVNRLLAAGIVVKSSDALERLGEVTIVVADKTGTLSSLVLAPASNMSPEALRLASSSRHPLARALAEGKMLEPIANALEVPGLGIESPNGARLGSARFVGAESSAEADPAVWFRSSNGTITKHNFCETPHAGVEAFLQGLSELDLPAFLLSGDQTGSVQRFAEKVGFKNWHAMLRPEHKLGHLQSMAAAGEKTLMFGDGINDAPALSAAHASVSFASATEVAQVAADVVLTRPAPELVPVAIRTARHARALIAQNLQFSAVYNAITVPLALAGYLSPALAAILMSSSSIIVLANGLRLKAAA